MKSNYKNKCFQGLSQAELGPLEIHVEDNDFEDAFKKFKAAFQKERVVSCLKEKECFEKPSVKRRRKRRQALERRLLAENREKLIKSGEWDKIQKRKNKRRQKKLETRIRRHQNTEDY